MKFKYHGTDITCCGDVEEEVRQQALRATSKRYKLEEQTL